MNSIKAIYIKQLMDAIKNSGVLIQFIIHPAMAFMMTNVFDMGMPGMPESFFVTMFAGMFVGMGMVAAIAPAIAEDRERNSLRFLLMAGVKSHEYLLGIGGAFFTFSLAGCVAFAVLMPGASITQMLVMAFSMMLGCIASILLGAIIGMLSKNEQEAMSISSIAGLIISFGPFIANISQNDTLQRIFRVLYTMNFVDADVRMADALESFGIILANVVVLALVFTWVYGKNDPSNKGGFVMNKKAVATILAVALIGGAGIRTFMWHNAGFIATDNARVTTSIVSVVPTAPGTLERFALHEGQRIEQGEVIGWVESNGPLRSPIDGLVVSSHAVENQVVSPMEPVAVIADTGRIHIQAHIEETDILRVRVGQTAVVTIDALGNQRFAGYVSNIGRITQAELSGNPLLFSTGGNLTRGTHLFPIEIVITDYIDLTHLIGANAEVRIPLR